MSCIHRVAHLVTAHSFSTWHKLSQQPFLIMTCGLQDKFVRSMERSVGAKRKRGSKTEAAACLVLVSEIFAPRQLHGSFETFLRKF